MKNFTKSEIQNIVMSETKKVHLAKMDSLISDLEEAIKNNDECNSMLVELIGISMSILIKFHTNVLTEVLSQIFSDSE